MFYLIRELIHPLVTNMFMSNILGRLFLIKKKDPKNPEEDFKMEIGVENWVGRHLGVL